MSFERGLDPDSNQYKLIVSSARGGRYDTMEVERLLDEGVNPNIQDANFYTPLMYASEYGNLEMVKLLVERGADIYMAPDGMNAFEIAVMSGKSNIIEFFLSLEIEYDYNTLWDKLESFRMEEEEYNSIKEIFDTAEAKIHALNIAKLLQDNNVHLNHETWEELIQTIMHKFSKKSEGGGSNKQRGTRQTKSKQNRSKRRGIRKQKSRRNKK